MLKERITVDSRNTPSTINLEEEEIVDAPGNDGNALMPEQIKPPNPWRKMMMMMMMPISLMTQYAYSYQVILGLNVLVASIN
jgi:hypothetical protein